MKDKLLIVLVVILGVLFFIYKPESTGRVYDCGMAEWHPDIPKEVKEECRRRAYEEWKRQNPKIQTISL